jgi:rod shape-determining protein MreC
VRNIFLFANRYFTLLFFLVLQGFCIYLITHYNTYHNAVFTSTTTQLTGNVFAQYNKVEGYFQLKKTNDSLVKANEKLYNKLRENFSLPDTINKTVLDSIRVDSLLQYRKYTYMQAKVVANQVNTKNNFIVLSRGQLQQIKIGMGVVDLNRKIVGFVTDVSSDFAVVMSLLHSDSHISGKLFKSGESGTISWDGKTPNLLTITGIPQSAKVAVGDSITSSYSTYFPQGLLIGTVQEVVAEKSSNNFAIKLKSATDFYTLQYVYVIDDLQQKEINDLLDKAKNKTK